MNVITDRKGNSIQEGKTVKCLDTNATGTLKMIGNTYSIISMKNPLPHYLPLSILAHNLHIIRWEPEDRI